MCEQRLKAGQSRISDRSLPVQISRSDSTIATRLPEQITCVVAVAGVVGVEEHAGVSAPALGLGDDDRQLADQAQRVLEVPLRLQYERRDEEGIKGRP
jgi:hypothetical protein